MGRADLALSASSELLDQMRRASTSSDPVRGLLADLWLERHNVPYVTTMFEASAEMTSATDVARQSRGKP